MNISVQSGLWLIHHNLSINYSAWIAINQTEWCLLSKPIDEQIVCALGFCLSLNEAIHLIHFNLTLSRQSHFAPAPLFLCCFPFVLFGCISSRSECVQRVCVCVCLVAVIKLRRYWSLRRFIVFAACANNKSDTLARSERAASAIQEMETRAPRCQKNTHLKGQNALNQPVIPGCVERIRAAPDLRPAPRRLHYFNFLI